MAKQVVQIVTTVFSRLNIIEKTEVDAPVGEIMN
jgi:hypothetical protein